MFPNNFYVMSPLWQLLALESLCLELEGSKLELAKFIAKKCPELWVFSGLRPEIAAWEGKKNFDEF